MHQLTDHVIQSRAESSTGDDCGCYLLGIEVGRLSRTCSYPCLSSAPSALLLHDVIEDVILLPDDLVVDYRLAIEVS